MPLTQQLYLALATAALLVSAQEAPPRPPLPNVGLCANPPVVRRVDLTAYAGQWYSIFNSGDATRVSGSQCTTANYTLRADGKVDVLNCQSDVAGMTPTCGRGVAQRQPAFNRTSRLQVKFPFFPSGPYEIAALLGRRNYGYYAAAVFSCGAIPTRVEVPSFFILARAPFAPRFTLHRLIRRLRAAGYAINDSDFVQTAHPHACKYQRGPGSFSVRSFPPSGAQEGAGPPPGVAGAGPPPGVIDGAGPPPGVPTGAGPPPGMSTGAGPPPGIPRT